MSESALPVGLRRENVNIESFVSWDEQPLPKYGGEDPPYLWWRKLRSWRRRQAAVEEWGAERDLDVRRLRALGLYPSQPPRFGPPRGRPGHGMARRHRQLPAPDAPVQPEL